jgi:hypothetical protein
MKLHRKTLRPCTTLETFILIMAVASSGCSRTKKDNMSHLAPAVVAGFKATGKSKTFDRKSIFTQLNGGAEVYLDYGLKTLLMREYKKPKHTKITLYIFNMGRAADAYGVFTHEQEGEDAQIGEDSDYADGLLRFWKGKYFVSVFAPRPSAAVKRAILELGKAVAGRIKHRGKRPELISWLPGTSLKPRSVRYLHTHQTLRHHLSVGPGNPLGLSRRTDVVTAEYALGSARTAALIVLYPDAAGASKALRNLMAIKPDKARPGGPPPIRPQARSCGRVLAAVFAPDPAQRRQSLLEKLTQKIPECKNG